MAVRAAPVLIPHLFRSILEEGRIRIAQPQPRILEGIEIVSFADPHERFPAIVHLLEVVERLGHRRKRDVRAIAKLGRPSRPGRHLDDLAGLERRASHLLDRVIHAPLVVRHVDRDRRRAARDDAEHVAVVEERLRNPLEQVANARRGLKLQVHVVHEEKEYAARCGIEPADGRQNDSFGRRERRCFEHVGDAAAMAHRHRRDLLLHAVLVDFEVVFLQVGDEAPLLVPRDDVHRDGVDLHAERGHFLLIGRRRPSRCWRLSRQAGDQRRPHHGRAEPAHFQVHDGELWHVPARLS